jgi:hypothetical protein
VGASGDETSERMEPPSRHARRAPRPARSSIVRWTCDARCARVMFHPRPWAYARTTPRFPLTPVSRGDAR